MIKHSIRSGIWDTHRAEGPSDSPQDSHRAAEPRDSHRAEGPRDSHRAEGPKDSHRAEGPQDSHRAEDPQDAKRDSKRVTPTTPQDSRRASTSQPSRPTAPSQGTRQTPPSRPGRSPTIQINLDRDNVEGYTGGVTISTGTVGVSINTKGSIGIQAAVPIPSVPGLAVTGGLQINVITKRIEQVSVGVSFLQIATGAVAIKDCDIIIRTAIIIPATNFKIGNSQHQEIPNCKPPKDPSEEESRDNYYKYPPEPNIPDPFEGFEAACDITVWASTAKYTLACAIYPGAERILFNEPTGIGPIEQKYKVYLSDWHKGKGKYASGWFYSNNSYSWWAAICIDPPADPYYGWHPGWGILTKRFEVVSISMFRYSPGRWYFGNGRFGSFGEGLALRSEKLQKCVPKNDIELSCNIAESDYTIEDNGHTHFVVTGYTISNLKAGKVYEFPTLEEINRKPTSQNSGPPASPPAPHQLSKKWTIVVKRSHCRLKKSTPPLRQINSRWNYRNFSQIGV